jgi:2-polyprenyl-3-methyl-5-hydroxy-6-metoxy-1,4-benzoquinol methylase
MSKRPAKHEHPHSRGTRDQRSRPQRGAGTGAGETGVTHWGEVAEWYDALVGAEGSEYHREVILPGILRMLSVKGERAEGMRVLDLACGQGVLARKLAAMGVRVTGVDAARPLIEAAERRNEADRLPIHYLTADATKLLTESGELVKPLEAGAFDAVMIVLAIQNITPLSPVWQACRRLLKAEGKLIVVMMHPCFRIPQQSDWYWDEKTQTQPRLVRQYLSSAPITIETHPGKAAHGKGSPATTHFHRPLQAYINTLGSAGLLVDHVEEWASHKTSQAGPRKAALDRARKEIPMFLAVRARGVG